MSQTITITLPDEIYQPLVEAALKQGRTPEELAAEKLARTLPKHKPMNTETAREAEERFARWIGSVSLGYPTGADNESIDADLAREYANTHEEED
jgi:hypothetical protein